MKSSIKNTDNRNYGIDLLRIVSMIMIVVLHILGKGGILKTAVPLSIRYETAWFSEIAAYCAVNCYALISGYVGCYSKFKYSNIAYIWLQVVFLYSCYKLLSCIIFTRRFKNRYFKGIFSCDK